VGESRNPSDPASYGLDPKTATLRIKFRVQKTTCSAAASSATAAAGSQELPGWEAVLWRGRLYVSVTPQSWSNGSKEAFVSLLEYAEDVLDCTHVVVCLAGKPFSLPFNTFGLISDNDHNNSKKIDVVQDKGIKMAIRNFMFLGFQPLASGHEFMPSNNPNLVSILTFSIRS